MKIKIITDSTADIPKNIVESYGIEVVPLKVRFGETEFSDGVDIQADEFYEKLVSSSELPKTSQPSVGDFLTVYEKYASQGFDIVSIHLTGKLSGTMNSALQAKQQMKTKAEIHVLDTQKASMGLGLIVLEAAKMVADGKNTKDVVNLVENTMKKSEVFILLHTLEYLEKGGRIGKAQALLGGLLSLKPLLILENGVVETLGKARTFKKGVLKLRETVNTMAPVAKLSVLYTTIPDFAKEFAQTLTEDLNLKEEPIVAQCGPVIGTYIGPGIIAVALLKA